ncbi:AP-4 complex subunit epsilon-1 [Linnemannia zychae]|nr:AP-4 complex subunit epsilon-1 [Linnemannia zychae]
MEFSRKLLSTLTTGQSIDSGRTPADASTFSEESLDALRLNISNPGISTATMKDNMDLTSSNYHHVVVALVTLCNMTLPDVIPSMVTHVLAALSHPNESVRKRALIALKNFYTLDADLILPHLDQIKDSLYDPEPSVMSAALGFFALAAKKHARVMRELIPALIKILQQVVDGRLPKGYIYHGTAAPWIQIRCLMIMAQLGQNDMIASTAMTPVVLKAFQKASQGVDAAFGVLFEVIRTLNSFHPAIILELCQSKDSTQNPLLAITRFATSSNPNLKYLGISMLCQVNPDAWSDVWWTEELLGAVVQALESRDAAIQKRAIDLLYRMLTVENAQNIIDRLVYAFFQEPDNPKVGSITGAQQGSMAIMNESHQQQQHTSLSFPGRKEKILGQILDAADRFGPSESWYLDLIFDLFVRGGPTITLKTVERVMSVFEQGEFGDKTGAATVVTDEYRLSSILEALARSLLVNSDPLVQSFILSALTKLSIKSLPNPIPTNITAVVRQKCQDNHNGMASLSSIQVQQRAAEFLMVATLATS